MKLISEEELDMLLTLSNLGGEARYGKLYRATGARTLPKQTFQNRLNSLRQDGLLRHRKIKRGPLGESWYILTPKAKKFLAGMSPNPWRTFLVGLRKSMESREIEEKDKPALMEKNVESLLDAAFNMARHFTVMAGLEEDIKRREALTLYLTEHVLKDLVRGVVSILSEHRGFASEKLRKMAEPVAIIEV